MLGQARLIKNGENKNQNNFWVKDEKERNEKEGQEEIKKNHK